MREKQNCNSKIFVTPVHVSASGGFEGGSATGIMGCTPCEDGYFSSPGMASCQKCPLGSYASRLLNQRDFYRCPSATSPEIRFSSAYVWKSPVTQLTPECTSLVVGADACTPCPPDRPYTREEGSVSSSDCRKCPRGQFFDGSSCQACRPECNRAMDEYETQACSHDRDRECGICDSSSCDPVYEYVLEEGCTVETGSRGCGSCVGRNPEHSSLVADGSGAACSWSCDEGYYSSIFSDGMCEPCTNLNSTSCPAGKIFSRCSDFMHRDASCEEDCNAEEMLKPAENSEWILTTIDEDYNVVAAEPFSTLPNVGCLWRCSDGYRLERLAEGRVNICVRV